MIELRCGCTLKDNLEPGSFCSDGGRYRVGMLAAIDASEARAARGERRPGDRSLVDLAVSLYTGHLWPYAGRLAKVG